MGDVFFFCLEIVHIQSRIEILVDGGRKKVLTVASELFRKAERGRRKIAMLIE